MAVHLTPDEGHLVQDSFGNVANRMKHDGSRIFIKMFEKHPDYKTFFPEFRDVSNDNLKRHPRMRAHIARVVTGLRLIIDCITDEQAFAKVTKSLCEFHHVRGVRRPVMEHFSHQLREYIGFVIKTPAVLSAWDKAIAAIVYNLSFDNVGHKMY